VASLLPFNGFQREEVTANYILVPLNPRDQVAELIPHIEEVARAGMTVVFLVPYQANGFFKNHRIREELSNKGMPTDRKALMKYSYDKQTRLANERISIDREALHRRGVEVIAYVYMDRLRHVLKSYRRNGGIHRVLKQRKDAISMRFLRRIVVLFSSFRRSSSFPYLHYCGEI
jgi:hypothetical protein